MNFENSMNPFPKKSMDELDRLDALSHKERNHFPIALILDNVRSMNNVGSIFRTADATNVDQIILCGLTPQPPHRDIQKTALGATESVQWRYDSDIAESINLLKNKGYKIVGVEQVHNSISLDQAPFLYHEPIAFIFGNEVDGVSDRALSLCDYCIEIPQFGAKHSFNISVSVGVILWDWIKTNLQFQMEEN